MSIHQNYQSSIRCTLSHLLGASALAYTLGVLCVEWIPLSMVSWTVLLMISLLLMLISLIALLRSEEYRSLISIFIAPFLCLSTLGGAMMEKRNDVKLQRSADPPLLLSQGSLSLYQIEDEDWLGHGELLEIRRSVNGLRATVVLEDLQVLTSQVYKSGKSNLVHRLALPLRVMITLSQHQSYKSLVAGDQVWFSGQLRWIGGRPQPQFDEYIEWLARRNVRWSGSGSLFKHRSQGSESLIQRYRRSMSEIIDSRDSQGAALVRGLVLGDKSGLSMTVQQKIKSMGLGHLLAVSGLHVGVCALLFGWFGRRFALWCRSPYPVLWGWAAMIMGAWLCVVIANYPMSAQRAALMLSIWAGSRLILHPLSALTSLLITAWILIIDHPSRAQEMGVQLSLLATFGLIVCSGRGSMNDKYRRLKRQELKELSDVDDLRGSHRFSLLEISLLSASLLRALGSSFSVAFTAWLFTAPVFTWHLGEINLISIFYNTILTPVISLTYIPLSLVCCLLAPLIKTPLLWTIDIGEWVSNGLIVHPSLKGATLIVGREATLPFLGAAMWWWTHSICRRLNTTQFTLTLLLDDQILSERSLEPTPSRWMRYKRLSIFTLTIGGVSLGLFAFIAGVRVDPAHSKFMYVGQGDATLISNGEGEVALFDVGTETSTRSLIRRLKLMGVNRLEWVAVSHLHPDHYGGILGIISELTVDRVIYHGRPPDLPHKAVTLRRESTSESGRHKSVSREPLLWSEVTEALALRHIPLIAQEQMEEEWGLLRLRWLFGAPPDHLKENDASLALLIESIESPQRRVLLSGDLEAAGELRLRTMWRSLGLRGAELSVWHINHHGSGTSTAMETVQTLRPRLGVLSLDGAHRFAFPHPRTVATLEARGVRRVRLDLAGDYTFLF